jgi:hypothetical protein
MPDLSASRVIAKLSAPPHARGSTRCSSGKLARIRRSPACAGDRRLFGFAGLWEGWKDTATAQWLRTFTIIKTNANELVVTLHPRMSVILAQANYERWLARR